MKKTFNTFLIILTTTVVSNLHAADCKKGFSSSWEFDQKTKTIKIDSLKKQEVCSFTKSQMNANMQFTILRGKKTIFSNKIFWSESQAHDLLNKKKEMAPIHMKALDYKILKFPVDLKGNEKYSIKNLITGEILGKGDLK